jgi:chromosome segregation protein
MRLKKIKLAGFKSFVDPTSIPFPDDMTAVVGPNGCGKSNVIDAVRWVLGESSAKNLRGDSMTDVIFNGSTARKPVSQCTVELLFDNSSGRIQGEYANYNELSVKRIVTRDGQSNYLLNGSKCRRRDVTDLFLGTGLGPRSYAIIEQGMISRLIESKPQELRVFIEEAAGISKYKERRRETENRIRHTKENLERLEDVRGELGQQLEKLQRQASAAKRYKELKARERQYKGELAALRWLKHSTQIEQLQSKISQQEADIEAFIAQQRGDEKGITHYRDKQQDLKDRLTDVQQQYFALGADITRLEQNQIHSKQRRQQIEQELAALEDSLRDALNHQQQQLALDDDLLQQLADGEPQLAVLQEQLEQSQLALQDTEEQLSTQQQQFRQQEMEYNQVKQQAQSRHGQIQSTMNMQMRTQQRLTELQQELQELSHNQLNMQLAELNAEIQLSTESENAARLAHQQAAKDLAEVESELNQSQEARLAALGTVQQTQAQIAALQSMQASLSSDDDLQAFLQSSGIDFKPLWQVLRADTGWEKALETVCTHWQSALVVDFVDCHQQLLALPGAQLLMLNNMTSTKTPGSLADKVSNDKVPEWLNRITIVDGISEAQRKQQHLSPGNSLITEDGLWLGSDWLISGCKEQDAGSLSRANQLRQLQQNAEQFALTLSAAEQALQNAQNKQKDQLQCKAQTEEGLKLAEQRLVQQQNQLDLLQHQSQLNQGRQQRLSDDIERHQQQLEDEKLQLEELAMQVEELEIQVADMQEVQQGIESQRENIQQQLVSQRSQVESIKTQNHKLALHLQAVRSQQQSLQDNQQRFSQQLEMMQQKRQSLDKEYQHLALPMEEQQQQLEILLEQRLVTEAKQGELHDALAEIAEQLAEAEKGQQGVLEKIQRMRGELESSKLECEGYRVRANGVLEQLQELQQALKPLLENLPEEANEQQWLAELEKTTAAVGRLGAVNLAAVEEYDIQSQRKQHLDEQNDDLCSALEILESAIRKIDKETRARFRDTFDKVNNDLKDLFPKVFGGGSAYLELTDDDLLDTGVTIMARPPGKKNSTIHLLSGGEKALTALSLVFAIFRLNPAPFCLLDEVDAPLDDANVGRFCKLVSEMSKTVQFIYITHNKIAMEMATHLTGVTMAEPGVSRMVSVDVEEAVAIAHA